MNDGLGLQGVYSKGYGIVPKSTMLDGRLSGEAKAIYSYLCSYAGSGNTAFPGRDKIAKDLNYGLRKYYNHLKLLVKYGYIKIEQQKENGKFKRNIYTIMNEIPCSCESNTVNEETPCCPHAYASESHTGESNTNNNSNRSNNKRSNSQSSLSDRDGQDEDNPALMIKTYTGLIKRNIGYEGLEHSHAADIGIVDEIVAVMIDTIMTESRTVRVDGEDKPRVLVTQVLLSLGYFDIEHVLFQFQSVTGRINKKKQYLLTMLYNSKLEKDTHIKNLITNDRAEGGII